MAAAAAARAASRRDARVRADAEAGRRRHDPRVGSAALRSAPHDLVQDPHRVLVHAQPPPEVQGGPVDRPRRVPDRGRSGRVVDPAERDDVRLQAPPGRTVAREGARERTRAHRGRRGVQRRALPHGQGQRERLHAVVARQGRSCRQVHRPLHAQGALRLVPRHDREPARRRHHREGVRREVRRPEEARGDGRHRPVDARQLPPEPRHDDGPPSELLRVGPAVHRPRRARGRRGQRVADGRVPRGQVRHRLGVHGHHQPRGLGEHQGPAEAEAPEAPDRPTSPRPS